MRMIGQLICAIGCLLTVGTICGARQASGFQVVDRATLREFVKKNGVSESMMVSDALANWITRKAGVAGYLVIQIGEVSKGRAKIAANLEGLVLICDG